MLLTKGVCCRFHWRIEMREGGRRGHLEWKNASWSRSKELDKQGQTQISCCKRNIIIGSHKLYK